jgi:hypothetical protein
MGPGQGFTQLDERSHAQKMEGRMGGTKASGKKSVKDMGLSPIAVSWNIVLSLACPFISR